MFEIPNVRYPRDFAQIVVKKRSHREFARIVPKGSCHKSFAANLCKNSCSCNGKFAGNARRDLSERDSTQSSRRKCAPQKQFQGQRSDKVITRKSPLSFTTHKSPLTTARHSHTSHHYSQELANHISARLAVDFQSVTSHSHRRHSGGRVACVILSGPRYCLKEQKIAIANICKEASQNAISIQIIRAMSDTVGNFGLTLLAAPSLAAPNGISFLGGQWVAAMYNWF